MMSAFPSPIRFVRDKRAPPFRVAGVVSFLLAIGTASALVPTSNELGIHFKVVASAPAVTVEISLRPRRDFDSVSIEAASGVASMTPPCTFSAVVAGGSYVCRVDVTGKSSDAAMTLNIVGTRATAGGGLPETEIHHLSVKNTSFVLRKKAKAASHHVVTSASTTSK